MGVVNILLVDDDEDDYYITRDFLDIDCSTKFHLDWISNYQDAVAEIRDQSYDAVLIDHDLGGKTGADLILELQDLGCKVPIIMYSGRSEKPELPGSSSYSHYLSKCNLSGSLLEGTILGAIRSSRECVTYQ